jgi:PAS domain S-box-containing protein
LEATSDLVSIATPDYQLEYMNHAGREMLGWSDDENLKNKTIIDVHPKWAFRLIKEEGIPVAIEKGIWKGETAILATDGTDIPVSQIIMSHKTSDGQFSYLSTIIRDITERKNTEKLIKKRTDELEEINNQLIQKNIVLDLKNEQLKELDLLKTEFVSTASHELRTPLTSVFGFAKTLLSKDVILPEKDKERYLKIISNESKRLGILIDHLLDITRYETGFFKLNKNKTNISKLISKTLESMKIPESITLKIYTSNDLYARLDSNKIAEVLINIIDNAVSSCKPAGKITIKASEINDLIKFSIRDTGTGITKDELPHIFEKFYRTKNSLSKKIKGSGLGLAITKTIIEAHNGKIWAKSESGKGTTIYFTIPVKKNISKN